MNSMFNAPELLKAPSQATQKKDGSSEVTKSIQTLGNLLQTSLGSLQPSPSP